VYIDVGGDAWVYAVGDAGVDAGGGLNAGGCVNASGGMCTCCFGGQAQFSVISRCEVLSWSRTWAFKLLTKGASPLPGTTFPFFPVPVFPIRFIFRILLHKIN